MKIDNTIDKLISQKLRAENILERENHISSGKLSASMLGQPLQWQVLKAIGVPAKEIDEYVLRVFKRGKDIEEWLVNQFTGLVETQKPVIYRNVVGFVDAVVDTKGYEFDEGIIPFEVKSVKNSKYKRIIEQIAPDHSHILQGALYALAMDVKSFSVYYVAADDLRVTSFVLPTDAYRTEIDRVIDRYDNQLNMRLVPKFVPIEAWQSILQYNNYPEWANLTDSQIVDKLMNEYPECHKKLINYK